MPLFRSLREALHKIHVRLNFQFAKHAWLNIMRDKTKALFGILGVGISIFLLTSIGIATDSLNYSTVKDMNDATGSADIIIMNTFQTDLTFDFAFEEDIIKEKLSNVEGVEQFFPRILMPVRFSSDNTNRNGSLELYGIDFLAEAENGRMGNLHILDEQGERTGKVYSKEPEEGECVLLWDSAQLLNVTRGDYIQMSYDQYYEEVEVIEICEQEDKFMQFETALVIMSVDAVQAFFHRDGLINHVVGKIKQEYLNYDARNVPYITNKLRIIAENVQDRLSINEFEVIMPKLEVLENSEFLFGLLSVFFWVVAIFSMLISGILIHGVLSTSVEDQIREFGVLRVVGGKKTFPLKIVIFEGLLLGVLGTLWGLCTSVFVAYPLIVEAIKAGNPPGTEINNMVYPETIITSVIIGISVPLVISLLPAISAAKKNLIKSISPLQSKEMGYEVKKEGNMNARNFIIGLSVASVGLLIFIALPIILRTLNVTITMIVLVGLLEAILIGLVLASVGLVPLLQKGILRIFKPMVRKSYDIIKVSLRRYRRRNTITIIMFSISFSFIFFLTGILEMEKENVKHSLNYLYGSDIVIVNQGYEQDGDTITLEIVEELKTFTNVKEVSYCIHNTVDLQAVLSLISDATSDEPKFIEELAASRANEMFSYYLNKLNSEYTVTAADVVSHDEMVAGLIAVDQKFPEMINKDLLLWDSPQSSFESSFPKIFAKNDTCILATSVANRLALNEVGKELRVTFYNPSHEEDPGNATLFEVSGISGGIPGFWNFRSGEIFSYWGSGIMVSIDTYLKWMNVSHAHTEEMMVDKIFINLHDNTPKGIEDTMDLIRSTYATKNYVIDDALSKIQMVEDATENANALIELILYFSVLTCIFGLLSAMYATILERQFEIGILRSMGMRTRDLKRMFFYESMTIMLSAGIMGTIIGSFCAYLLLSNIAILLEFPLIFTLPQQTLFRVYFLTIIVSAIGMKLILRKLKKQSITEIFRKAT